MAVKWIIMSLFLTMVLQITAVAGQLPLSFTVRAGDDVTLPCDHVINDHGKCNSTSWAFSRFSGTAATDLFEFGKIVERAKSKSDRLSVTANCSLVIKKVTEEDVGRYFCIQLTKRAPHSLDLSVINITKHEDDENVTLRCSMKTYGGCRHKVKWLFKGQDVDKDNRDLKTSQSGCSANVTFATSHFIFDNYEMFKCNVTSGKTGNVFPFKPRSSAPGSNDPTTKPQDWWVYIIVAVGLTALLISAVAFIRWKRNKGKKAQNNTNMGLSSKSAGTKSAPETSQDTADPEDGVSYVSIIHTKQTNNKARVRGREDAVTYSTVKPPPSSAGASADPSHLYDTIK